MISKKEKHFHTYKKRQFNSGKIYWSCTAAGCNHYRHDSDMPGRDAKCPYCEEIFKITRQQISGGQSLLHCINCYSPRGFGRKRFLQQLKERQDRKYIDKYSIDSIIESVMETKLKKKSEGNGNSGQENTGTE